MKVKSLALWLTLLGGVVGIHRIYLIGRYDNLSRLLTVLTGLGLYGVQRARTHGLDDMLCWFLIPFLGITLTVSAFTAIWFGLMGCQEWNRRFNPTLAADHAAGHTNWLTVAGLVASLMAGATVLLATLAFSFQHYFEYRAQTDDNPSTVESTQ